MNSEETNTPNLLLAPRKLQRGRPSDAIFAYGNNTVKQLVIECREQAKASWERTRQLTKEIWMFKSRGLVAQQPTIKDRVLESFRNNPTKSYAEVETDIGQCCSTSVIQRWMESYGGYVI